MAVDRGRGALVVDLGVEECAVSSAGSGLVSCQMSDIQPCGRECDEGVSAGEVVSWADVMGDGSRVVGGR